MSDKRPQIAQKQTQLIFCWTALPALCGTSSRSRKARCETRRPHFPLSRFVKQHLGLQPSWSGCVFARPGCGG